MKERRKRRSTKDIEESIINAATRFIETAYSGGYPFSISGDIRSVPS